MKFRHFVLGAALLIALVGCAFPPTHKPAQAGSPVEPSAPVPVEETVVSNWYVDAFGTYEPVTQTGNTDAVLALPTGAKAGIITATYNGSSNFIISVLDANNERTADSPVNTIGAYTGTTGFGFYGFGQPETQLQIMAEGDWSITVSPVASAPAGLSSGAGDAVTLYDGPATKSTFAHDGSRNFIVNQYASTTMPGISINKIGPYTGEVPVNSGPSVIVIMADGNWSIQ